MVVVFMGACCTGKSSVAELIRAKNNIQVITGKDYLRLSSDEEEAWRQFLGRIENTLHTASGESLIYILDDADKADDLLNIHGVRCVKFSATLEVIKSRYEARMQGALPDVVVKMLSAQLSAWNRVSCDIVVDSSRERDISEMAQEVVMKFKKRSR